MKHFSCNGVAAAVAMLLWTSAEAGVVTYHRFENAAGTQSLDSGGNEQTGVVKTSIVIPGVGKGRFTGGTGGKFGGALYFDAPYGDATFAQFTSDFDIATAGSVSLFVEHDQVGYRQAYLRGGGSDFGLEMHHSNTVFSSMTGGDTYFAGGAQMDDSGAWRHVVVTWDAANGNSQRLYVDGVLQREAANCCVAGLGPTFLDKVFTVGQRIPQGTADTQRSFDGGVDDLAFWNRQLSDTEIAQVGASGAGAVASGLVVHWNLDDPVGTLTAVSNGGSNSINLLVGGGGGVVEYGPDLVAGAGPTLPAGGAPLDAAEFDDSKPTSPAANTKITIPDSPVMDFDKTEGTVVMWVNKTATGYGETYLGTDDSTAEILLRASNSGRTIMRVNGDAVYETDAGANLLDQTGEWHHLAFTWNAATGAHTIYIDGVAPPQSLVEGTPGPWDASAVSDTGNWTIGFDIPERPFRGFLADFAVFNEELDATQIGQIIDAGVEEFIACAEMTGARTQLRRVLAEGDSGNDHLRLRGRFVLPDETFQTIDPSAVGARFRIEALDETPRVDVVLPPGNRAKAAPTGWKRDFNARKWVFYDKTRDPGLNGIVRFVIRDIRSTTPPSLEVIVTGRRGEYPILLGDDPLRVIASIGNTVLGECGETVYAAGQCTWDDQDRELECEAP